MTEQYEDSAIREWKKFWTWNNLFLRSSSLFLIVFFSFFTGFLLWLELKYGILEMIFTSFISS